MRRWSAGVQFHARSPRGVLVLDQLDEAALWGVHTEVHAEDGLEISRCDGAFGTLYEVVCDPSRVERLSPVLDLLPPDAVFVSVAVSDEDDADGVALVVHYWAEANNRARTNTSGSWPATPISKPTE
jgi:hypothetical protein